MKFEDYVNIQTLVCGVGGRGVKSMYASYITSAYRALKALILRRTIFIYPTTMQEILLEFITWSK